jgi:Ca2+-binding RTX toxin-like protein
VALAGTLIASGFQPAGIVAYAQVVPAAPAGQGFNLNASDLRFIMKQIRIAERHAATATASNPCGTLIGADPDQIPPGTSQTVDLPWGLRTVDGSCNHLTPGQESYGTADQLFPRMLTKELRSAEPSLFGPPGPTTYTQTSGNVFDSQPRRISNLIVDQTASNPAAVEVAGPLPEITPSGAFFIPNVAPDAGLSAPFNSWFTLFGQFFDHGLDLVNKGGNGLVFVPLQPDDPLFAEASALGAPFMILSRATHGGDHEANNQTSPWVDQSQTYTSHASHQVFLREYTLVNGRPVGTGRLITGRGHGMATWADVKAQARNVLGIALNDQDALAIPLLATDAYGRFLRGPTGFPQMVKVINGVNTLVEGSLAVPVDTSSSIPTGHAFLDDIAHLAVPNLGLNPDADSLTGNDDNDNTTYDDELLNAHFIAGDGRVNENIGLTAVHHIFHSEHNRLVGVIDSMIATLPEFTQAERDAWHADNLFGFGVTRSWDYAERLFQAARFVTEMQYQHLVFEEFIRKVQPMVNAFTGFSPSINPAIRAEFAHAVYRFGHSMLTETIARVDDAGNDYSVSLFDAFLNPPSFFDNLNPDTDPQAASKAAGAIIRGMTRQVANEIDEFVTEALRNRLLGLPLDLPALNMARARDAGIPRLNEARRQFFAASQNTALVPYSDWVSFGFGIRHPESLANFVAAFGTHPLIVGVNTTAGRREAAEAIVNGVTGPGPDGILVDDLLTVIDEAADNTVPPSDRFEFMNSIGIWGPGLDGRTTTGVDDIDLWVGGLAEKQMVFGGLLGPTFNYVFEKQMEDLQDGDRMYYLNRTAGLNLLVQLEGNSFAELITRNTTARGLPADSFSHPTFVFELAAQTNPLGIVDDPATPDNEPSLLVRMADGTIRYPGVEHAVFNGTSGNDRVWAGEGDDTLSGFDGNDMLQGGDGNDTLIGGNGNDFLFDLAGDDTLKGGDGNDVLSSGQGFGADLNQGGRGHDWIVGGNDLTEDFGGPGNDFIYAGDGGGTVFGDDGDDWIEAGPAGAANLLQGDNGAPFQDDPNQPGNDVILCDTSADYDSEGGDDIMMMGPGIQRAEGMLGFDWAIHKNDPNPSDSDLRFTGLLPPSVDANRDRFDLVEGMSGWIRDDRLRGDDRDTTLIAAGDTLDAAGIARIPGLADILPPGATSFSAGNIILGGAGSDVLEGRGGNDILDGDRWLDVQIRVPNPPAGVAEFHDRMATLNSAVFNGLVDPGSLQIIRSIKTAPANPLDVDIAVFSGPLADYDITHNTDGSVTVAHTRGTALDGVDTLRNIEILEFVDQPVPVNAAGPVVISLSPVADTFVRNGAGNASVNFGTETALRVQQSGVAGGVSRTYLKFRVPTIPTGTVIDSFKLRFFVVDPSANVLTVYSAGNAWTEANLTFNNAEDLAPRRAQRATFSVPAGQNYTEITLPVTLARSEATLSFEIVGGSDLATFNSRESIANRPQLNITLASGSALPPTAPTSVTAVAGNASASVTFLAPSSDGGSPITSYVVRTIAVDGGAVPAPVTTTTLSATINGLSNGSQYRFTVEAVNAVGSSPASTQSNLVTPSAAPRTFVFVPVADAFTRQSQPARNFGTVTTLNARGINANGSGENKRAYLKFNVTGLGGSVATATLRLFVTDPSVDLHRVRRVNHSNWTETGITWDNAPGATLANATPVGTFTPNRLGYIDIPIQFTTPISNGLISFDVRDPNADESIYGSRESANPPQLIITTP